MHCAFYFQAFVFVRIICPFCIVLTYDFEIAVETLSHLHFQKLFAEVQNVKAFHRID